MRRTSFWLTLCVVALSACDWPSGGGTSEARHGGQPLVPVTVATVTERDAPVALHAIGTVESYSTVTVRPQVSGQLAEVHFTEGAKVKKDELLFSLDPRPFRAALHQAEANRARDFAQAKNAEVEAQRLAKLFEEGFVSREEHDQARARADSLRALVKSDEAAEEAARLRLDYGSIRSPIDGRVGQLLAHAGNVLKENETPLAVIHQVRPIYVRFSVPERELPQIRRSMASGTPVVEVETADSAPLRGGLHFVDSSVDPTTATVLLKGLFPNEDEKLWPGQFVNVALTLSVRPKAVIAPRRAVLTGQRGLYAFVVRPDGTVESRPVIAGNAMGEETVVEEGLHPGEQVVVDGQLRLAPGMRVEIRSASPTNPERPESGAS